MNESRRNAGLHRQHDYGEHWEVILSVTIPVSCLAVLILNCLHDYCIFNPASLFRSLGGDHLSLANSLFRPFSLVLSTRARCPSTVSESANECVDVEVN